MENRLYDYAGDSTLLAVVRKPADRPAVAASLNSVGLIILQKDLNNTSLLRIYIYIYTHCICDIQINHMYIYIYNDLQN